jgi:tRNA modification GTPase
VLDDKDFSDTIIAPITSSHSKQRTALRLSGESLPIIAKDLFGEHFKFNYQARTLSFKVDWDDGNKLDFDIDVYTMPKYCSFTHEPVLELHYPANEKITVNILEQFYKKGIKPAAPGEFSKRAFMNGRLALSQANSVAALVASKTQEQRDKALKLLNGNDDDFIVGLKNHLFELRRNLEAVIDFPEEPDIAHKQFVWRECIDKVEKHLNTFKENPNRENFKSYLQIVILGLANAGKSSLIKSLIPGSSPVISHIAGTTLDLIPYQMEISGQTIIIFDSPGFKDAENHLDQMSLENLKNRISSFDACIYLHSNKEDNAHAWIDKKDFPFFIDVQSKADLIKETGLTNKKLAISSLTGMGINTLKEKILEFSQQHQSQTQSPWSALEKRIANLVSDKLEIVKKRLYLASDEEELAAYDLDDLLESLDEMLYQDGGTEPLLDSIFKNFCIGK